MEKTSNYLKIRESESVILIVDGSIGAGKSTLIKEICKKLNQEKRKYKVYGEEGITGSEILKGYYENPYLFGNMLQKEVIANRIKQMKKVKKEEKEYEFIIFDRTVLSTRIFTKLQYRLGYISKKQKSKLIKKTNKYLANKYMRNAIVIYLKPKEETEWERIQKRGTEADKRITKRYIEELRKEYEREIKQIYIRYMGYMGAAEYSKESEKYQEKVKEIYEKMKRTYNQNRQYYVINILFNKETQETYVSRRIEKGKEYYGYLQVPGGRIEYGETALQACIRETKEETGLTIEESQITYLFTHKKVDGVKGKDCEVFVTEITKKDKLERIEELKNEEWKAYKIEELYNDHLNELTPTLRKFEKEIYQYIFEKYLRGLKPKERKVKSNRFENLLKKLNKLTKDGK